jgi:energy-coupling factor transporter ATP-binding protein EcfA2
MIEARGLTKRYGGRTAVDDLTFRVRPGTVTGFLGPNGAGKSTTVLMLTTLLPPTAGTARVGHDILREGPAVDRVRAGRRVPGVGDPRGSPRRVGGLSLARPTRRPSRERRTAPECGF